MVPNAVAIHQRTGSFGNKPPNDAVRLTMSRYRHFLDLGPEFRQYLDRSVQCGIDVGFRTRLVKTFSQHANPNALEVAPQRLRIGLCFEFRLPWIERVSARDHFEH